MKVTIRSDSVQIEGYVNAVERYSKPLLDNRGRFIERIMPKAFARAIDRADDGVFFLLNHNSKRILANTVRDAETARLVEDNIGLRAFIETSDAHIVQKARENKLVGWSFGFNSPVQTFSKGEDGMEQRTITDLELVEVSILDDERVPAYYGTSVEMRSNEAGEEEATINEFRAVVETQAEYVTIKNEEGGEPSKRSGEDEEGDEGGDEDPNNPETPDLSEHKTRINKLVVKGLETDE